MWYNKKNRLHGAFYEKIGCMYIDFYNAFNRMQKQ